MPPPVSGWLGKPGQPAEEFVEGAIAAKTRAVRQTICAHARPCANIDAAVLSVVSVPAMEHSNQPPAAVQGRGQHLTASHCATTLFRLVRSRRVPNRMPRLLAGSV